MNVAWWEEIKWGMMWVSLLTMILKVKFRRLIGQKSFNEDGFGHFGMRAIRKEEEALRSFLEMKKF